MNITNRIVGYSGVEYLLEYCDTDSFEEIEKSGSCTQTYGVCFTNNQIVIVYQAKKQTWGGLVRTKLGQDL